MNRPFLGGSVILFVLATLAVGEDPPPNRLKKAADEWWGRIEDIQKNRDAQLEKLFKEMRESEAELNKYLKPARNAVQLGENQFHKAAAQLDSSLKDLESNPKLHGMILIQLSGLYATMGDYEKAQVTVAKAWRKMKEYAAAASDDPWPVIDAAAAAGAVLLLLQKPDEAASCIDHGLALCGKPWKGISLQGTPLQARCLLAKAELANFLKDYWTGRKYAAEGLELVKRLYPRPVPPRQYPVTLESAVGLNSLAVAKSHLEQELEAFELLREAQQILEKLFPQGHLSLALIYSNLAQLYIYRGRIAEAKDLLHRSYDTFTKFFPDAIYKNSHPGLIHATSSLGNTADTFGSHNLNLRAEALQFRKRALDESRKYYTSAHASKIETLLNYGWSLLSAGRIGEAENHFREALRMAYERYPKSKYPHGHPVVAHCLLYVGRIQVQRPRRYREARQTLEQARKMFQSYGQQDNPYLSLVTQYLGMLAFLMKDRSGAQEAFVQALTLDQRQLGRYARIASEAEAIAFAQPRRISLHGYLSVSRGDGKDTETYDLVWTAKSTVTRILRERLALLHAEEMKSSRVLRHAQELREVTGLIGDLVSRRQQDESHRKTLVELMEKEERLRRALAEELPDFQRTVEMDQDGPAELANRLPEGSVFVDFIRYKDFLAAKEGRDRYAAFVLAPGKRPKRVELDYAEPIQDAVKLWRKAVVRMDPGAPPETRMRNGEAADKQAAKLRSLVWEKVVKHFPNPSPKRIYLALDGDLTCFPFAALPGESKGSILLEEHTIAYVPHGPFLLDRLRHPVPSVQDSGGFLSLGDVAFDVHGPIAGSIGAEKSAQRLGHAPIALQGKEATPENLCSALMHARFAHLATHGFFDSEALKAEHRRLEDYLNDWQFESRQAVEGVGVGSRSPLSYTGLVLAQGTVLTGSTISTLPLEKLHVVVLSACQTGLGEYTPGERVDARLADRADPSPR